MTIQAVSWVLDNSEATLGARLALISIASHADKHGQNSCPGFTTIAEDAKLSRRGAVAAVQKLVDQGMVEITGHDPKYGTNIYRVVGMAASEATTPQTSEETSPVTPPKPSEVTSRGGEAASEAHDISSSIKRLTPLRGDKPSAAPNGLHPQDVQIQNLVGYYVDECKSFGYEPVRNWRARVGKELKSLVREKPIDLIRWALGVAAEEHKSPAALVAIVSDLEGRRSGVKTR